MSNVSITQSCNRKCSYCFAKETMELAGRSEQFMTWESFEKALGFLHRSGVDELTLLGGEPTIHPSFVDMVQEAMRRGLRVLVLSGGIIPERAMKFLETVSAGEVSLMLNVAPPGGEFGTHEHARQQDVMRRLGPRVVLGLNIDAPDTPLDFLIDHIRQYGLERCVRLGLAHPIVGGSNRCLKPREYAGVGRRVMSFHRRARAEGIRIDFDCGWVPCMFDPAFLEQAGLTPQEIGQRCNPILDIIPGDQVLSCYPLASIARKPLLPSSDAVQTASSFERDLSAYRPFKLFKHCDSCAYLHRGDCLGGCIAAGLNRSRPPAQERGLDGS